VKDSKPCDCEQYREAKQAPQSDAPLPSPLVPGTFDPTTLELAKNKGLRLRMRAAGETDVPRPPDSLLRQHCALTI
jgi:hypothetical protein